MPKQLLICARNPSRIDLVNRILHNAGIQVVTLDRLAIVEEVTEDQPSTHANAEKKARSYNALSNIPTLAMDGGLHIDRFSPERQPGVLVKRIAGNGSTPTDSEILKYYRDALQQAGGESLGTWTGSTALAVSDQQVYVSSFTFVVRFTVNQRGSSLPGLVLDPLMIDPDSGKYYTEIPVEERPYYQAVRGFLLDHIRYL
jgi:inosine/xanthosine triphosphate pyrophosphatase family protein